MIPVSTIHSILKPSDGLPITSMAIMIFVMTVVKRENGEVIWNRGNVGPVTRCERVSTNEVYIGRFFFFVFIHEKPLDA